MTDDLLSKRLEQFINKMPSLPVSVTKVQELCSQVYPNASDLNKVISLDPVLTGRLLKLINSAYYGLPNQVTSLVRAIIMLGTNTVKNITLSAAVLAALPSNKIIGGMDLDAYWHHCLSVGVVSKMLANKQGVDPASREEYFVAGLLHDLGKIPLNAILGPDYLQAFLLNESSKKSLYTIESENLFTTHCKAGAEIAKLWKLGGVISDVIEFHHNIEEYSGEHSNVIFIVSLANYFSIAYEIGSAGDKNPEKPPKIVWDSTGFKESIFKELKIKVDEEIEKAKIFLSS